MKNGIKYLLLVFLFYNPLLFSQQLSNNVENLMKKLIENKKLMDEDSERAFKEVKKIENEAQRINANEVELRAIEIQFLYHQNNNDFEKMLITARFLYQKADNYKFYPYQIIAKRHLFEAYAFSDLVDKAFFELEQGIELIKKSNEKDSLNIAVKLDLLIAYSNYYLLKEEYQNQLKYLKLCRNEIEKIPQSNYKNRVLSIYYLYLAGAHNNLNELDSAKYYVKLSQLEGSYNSNNISHHRFLVLGGVAMKEEKYKEALFYYKKAENTESYKNHLNISSLYDDIIQIYQKFDYKDSIKLYQTKRDSLKLTVSENQNKSLHKLLNEKKENIIASYLYILVLLLLLMMIFMVIVIQKNKKLEQQEKISQQYLKAFSKNQTKNYSELLKMLEKADPAFMNYFDEAFPTFSKKILDINSKIIQSEIEFCALLKLKISTKDIARYKYITPKTVQNKKYLVRKKLNIPVEVDIYQWFDVF